MCEYLKRSDNEGLVTYAIDRLVRFELISALGDIIRPFEDLMSLGGRHKRIWCDISGPEGLDPHNPEHQSKIMHAAEFAAMERRKIAKRTHSAKEMNRHEADRVTDKLPKGVRFVVDDSEEQTGHFEYTKDAEKVKEAYRRVLVGETLRGVTHKLGYKSMTHFRRIDRKSVV